MLRLIALVLPLGLDTFAVSAAIGVVGVAPGRRVRFGLLFAAFEGGMPLAGLVAGSALGRLIGSVGEYVAIAALGGLGAYMLLVHGEREEARVRRLVSTSGVAMIGLGISISLDELAIGFSLGLIRVPVAAAVILIALQAFLVSQIGFQAGRRVGQRYREGAERLAGAILIALATVLLISKVASLPI